jgi:hypothetical protein
LNAIENPVTSCPQLILSRFFALCSARVSGAPMHHIGPGMIYGARPVFPNGLVSRFATLHPFFRLSMSLRQATISGKFSHVALLS